MDVKKKIGWDFKSVKDKWMLQYRLKYHQSYHTHIGHIDNYFLMLCEMSKEEEDQDKPDSDMLKGLHNNLNWHSNLFSSPVLCEVFKL